MSVGWSVPAPPDETRPAPPDPIAPRDRERRRGERLGGVGGSS